MKKCDTLIIGNIITMDSDNSFVEALVCNDGKVVYSGSKQIAQRLCDENTKVLDYTGKYIYPGFFDSHCHGILAGQRIAFQCNMSSGQSLEEYVEIVRKYVLDNPNRKVYMGAGWIKKGNPTAAMLDDISDDIPIVLHSADGHSIWVNSACLKDCGIDSSLAKEMGSDIIHVDELGNPNGLLSEAASQLVLRKYSPSKQDIKEGLLKWQEFAFKNGITACVEAAGDAYPESLQAYKELVEEGKWKLRTYAYNCYNSSITKPDEYVTKVKEDISKYNDDYFKVIGAKLFFDGVVEAHTAYLLDAYNDDPTYHGVFNFVNKEHFAKEIIEKLNSEKIPVHIHTIGDAAVKFAVDCIGEAEIKNCNFEVRNCLAHLQIVNPEDIKRIGSYNIVAIVAPLWIPIKKDYFLQELDYLGEDRAFNSYPVKSFEDAGATICYHSDYPVSSIVNYPKTFYVAKKRKDPIGGAKSVKNPDEAVSQFRSLLAMTSNAAYMVYEEANLGKLLPGKVANIVVYDKNLLDEDINSVVNAKLVATIVDGEIVYLKEGE